MDDEHPGSPRRRDVRRRFDRAAASFDDADFVHRVSGDGLLERLEPLTVEAQRVVDLGAATGSLSLQLARRFRGSRVLAVDQSLPMLARARRRHTRFSRVREINAVAEALPLPAGSIDVVVANMLLPLIAEPGAVLGEVARVLRRDGVFAFATLGPDSLGELREAFAGDGLAHVMPFADMHDVGDALVRAGLRDPVLDVDRLAVSFADPGALYRDLGAAGARNALAGRRPTLTGKDRFGRAEAVLAKRFGGGPLEITLELVYGHAFGGTPRGPAGEFVVPIEEMRRRRRQP